MKKIFLSLLLICFAFALTAQWPDEDTGKKGQSLIHLESGMIYPLGSIRDHIAIRQNVSSFYVDQISRGQVSSENYGIVFGIRWEYINKNQNLGLSTGIRFTAYQTEITGFSSQRADFFYLRYSVIEGNTKFARVKNINETSNFFSVPVEVRLIPFRYRQFRFFGKVGAEFGAFNLFHDTDVEFQEEKMNDFSSEVLKSIDYETGNFYSALYASIGLSLGKAEKINYLLEILLPGLYLSHDNFVLADVDRLEGFRASVQFPLH